MYTHMYICICVYIYIYIYIHIYMCIISLYYMYIILYSICLHGALAERQEQGRLDDLRRLARHDKYY